MKSLALAGVRVALCLLMAVAVVAAADEAALFRVFLKDGTSLVSYGEPARVDDRIVFSMPTGPLPNPPLQLVNIQSDKVDWERTNRYADAARAAHYVATQAEGDYAELTTKIATALNDVALTDDPVRRLAIVEQARKTLADWPQSHFGYRRSDVLQMLSMLDEAIADLRASTGGRFDLSLVAVSEPPPSAPLLPPPSPRETIEQTLAAAWLADSMSDRESLLATALSALDRDAAVLPPAWAVPVRAQTKASLDAELLADRRYDAMTKEMMGRAEYRGRRADVRGLESLLLRISRVDAEFGHQRPDSVKALVASVEIILDGARRARLERDRWAMRVVEFNKYYAAINTPLDILAGLKPALEDIKSLAGSTPGTLVTIRRAASQIEKLAATIPPPPEFTAAHAMLLSAAGLADSAARIRREAVMTGEIARAWDASSAAAGALMLAARAKTDMLALLRPPKLP